ncbi:MULTISPECIES: preprotein translocase subunit SecA [unclassified Breznakia]|uniref:preprotein translocase subunit SecA n=1 Tax=unclassified Breznakia TaxID=2623764 RepID=UPI002476FCEA|nr:MULTISPECIES: preprotein translocase subunit SecA [unclassified Breznakia]MDH6366611.1 preprotein translocase subunit SecA [Breznakia sp. PH1-1]MDH6403704.1 preprotein translocase subunit SecA [Breznakia sp. PF1-11]MDH6411413.1 preprotein translocase subunit SecA [Breznakia sp. PFB1-11]MDH6413856.1 preprotein translocase subunit SecA [Breznakia sp. PFB1-14]MDH6416286.1 preprotein translocase subunit SecA [Breznakia sp. PFB1-4]
MGILNKLFGGESGRLKQIESTARKVDALAGEMEALSDDALRGKTAEFKARVQGGETLDDILVEAFAVSREAAKRVIGEFPYLVQIMGAIVMHNGDIAEMKTGEGKTLTSTMAVYLNALSSQGVHVVTVNEYLASRDAEWMGQIYEFLGLSVGVNMRALTPSEKRAAYACDIMYTTNSELGFDYLRDNMVTDVKDRVMRGLNTALVDEVDSILVDESRTPLIISGGAKKTANLYQNADYFAKMLKPSDYEVDEKTRQVRLTESGVARAEKNFKVKNLYDVEHSQLVHHITMALRANYIMMRDVEYVVDGDEIVIVDQFTGRLMKGRAYSDGLHQAIEAKEGVKIKEETSTLATITYQNFFRLYDKLCGMTGTAKTEEEEFLEIYNMRVIEIPTNRPVARMDYPDAIFETAEYKFLALVEEVKTLHEKGQPVLVGTISVEVSEHISQMLKRERIKHEVLNAKNHEREADIIAKAGQVGSVTIATNMAGRGTDIKLSDESKVLGGLAVLGSERHESRRIDNQLRGRSGRQGDPGFSRFYVSLQDTLMVRFGQEGLLNKAFSSLEGAAIESKMVSKAIGNAQKRVEGQNYDVRKQLLDYDDVLRQQREIIYDLRNHILENENVHDIVKEMFERVTNNMVDANIGASGDVDTKSLVNAFEVLGFEEGTIKEEMFFGLDPDEVKGKALDFTWDFYDAKLDGIREQYTQFERNVVLRTIDRNWIDHIDTMSKLRDGIHLRSFAQSNPLQQYVQEGFEMFDDMSQNIAREIVFFAIRIKIERKEA